MKVTQQSAKFNMEKWMKNQQIDLLKIIWSTLHSRCGNLIHFRTKKCRITVRFLFINIKISHMRPHPAVTGKTFPRIVKLSSLTLHRVTPARVPHVCHQPLKEKIKLADIIMFETMVGKFFANWYNWNCRQTLVTCFSCAEEFFILFLRWGALFCAVYRVSGKYVHSQKCKHSSWQRTLIY